MSPCIRCGRESAERMTADYSGDDVWICAECAAREPIPFDWVMAGSIGLLGLTVLLTFGC